MKKRLQKLTKYKTQSRQDVDQSANFINIISQNSLLRNSMRKQSLINSYIDPFTQKSLNLKSDFQIKRYKKVKKTSTLQDYSKINILQSRNQSQLLSQYSKIPLFKKKPKQKSLTKPIYEIIYEQMVKTGKSYKTCESYIQQLTRLCSSLEQQVLIYNKTQQSLKCLTFLAKQTGSKTLLFSVYSLCGLVLSIYGSYSLSIFYFDKCLKILIQKEIIYQFQKHHEIQIYKTIARIFLSKGDTYLAKHFAYKSLRKAWYAKNVQQEMNAYDLLGKVYHTMEIKSLSHYFHNRMCMGEVEDKDIVKLSNLQFLKAEKEKPEILFYQTIHIFIQDDKVFQDMLDGRYRMKDRNFQDEKTKTNNFFFHTHRSPNRNLNTYRVLQRKMIQQKKSKQLHFLKPKQGNMVRKLLIQFDKLIIQIKQLNFLDIKDQPQFLSPIIKPQELIQLTNNFLIR